MFSAGGNYGTYMTHVDTCVQDISVLMYIHKFYPWIFSTKIVTCISQVNLAIFFHIFIYSHFSSLLTELTLLNKTEKNKCYSKGTLCILTKHYSQGQFLFHFCLKSPLTFLDNLHVYLEQASMGRQGMEDIILNFQFMQTQLHNLCSLLYKL